MISNIDDKHEKCFQCFQFWAKVMIKVSTKNHAGDFFISQELIISKKGQSCFYQNNS